jgi:hypothetical protein
MNGNNLAWDPNCDKKYEHVDLDDVRTSWLLILSDMTWFRRFLKQAERLSRPLNV